jgi:hypothetical protein
MEIFWNIPTQGDGRHLATDIGARELSAGDVMAGACYPRRANG